MSWSVSTPMSVALDLVQPSLQERGRGARDGLPAQSPATRLAIGQPALPVTNPIQYRDVARGQGCLSGRQFA